MKKQSANGNIVIDSVSIINTTMKFFSSYKRTINRENNAKILINAG